MIENIPLDIFHPYDLPSDNFKYKIDLSKIETIFDLYEEDNRVFINKQRLYEYIVRPNTDTLQIGNGFSSIPIPPRYQTIIWQPTK